MGAGASAKESVDQDTAKKLVGDHFNEEKFKEFATEDGKIPQAKWSSLTFQQGYGAEHGTWKDETHAATNADIHAPRYFEEKGFDGFCGSVESFIR